MTAFKEFDEAVDRLVLPIHGHEYTIPLVSIEGRARWEQVQATQPGDDTPPLTDDEFLRIWLGSALDELRNANVADMAIDRAAGTSMTFNLVGKDAAEIFWETGGHPKAIEKLLNERLPNRAARRSKSTAAATTTPSPKRGSGTKSRPK